MAFGSLDGDGRADPRFLAGVTVVAVPARDRDDWWDAVGALGPAEEEAAGVGVAGALTPVVGIPPGEQVQSSLQRVLAAPGAIISTTGASGTMDMWVDPRFAYHFCALSPKVEGLNRGSAGAGAAHVGAASGDHGPGPRRGALGAAFAAGDLVGVGVRLRCAALQLLFGSIRAQP